MRLARCRFFLLIADLIIVVNHGTICTLDLASRFSVRIRPRVGDHGSKAVRHFGDAQLISVAIKFRRKTRIESRN